MRLHTDSAAGVGVCVVPGTGAGACVGLGTGAGIRVVLGAGVGVCVVSGGGGLLIGVLSVQAANDKNKTQVKNIINNLLTSLLNATIPFLLINYFNSLCTL